MTSTWLRLEMGVAALIERQLARAFRRLGMLIADRPYTAIAVSIVLAAVLSSGVFFIKAESSASKLYAPQNNRGQVDLDAVDHMFAQVDYSVLSNSAIVYTGDGRNLLSAAVLNKLYEFVEQLRALRVEHDGEVLTYRDLCEKSQQRGSAQQCAFIGIVDLMEGPVEDSSLPRIDSVATTDLQGAAHVTPLFAGGRTLSEDGQSVVRVQAWKLFLNLDTNSSRRASREMSRTMFEFLEDYTKDQNEASPFKLAYEFYFSETEELEKSTNSDLSLLMLCFFLVITFSFLVVRSYSNFVLSKGNVVWGAQLGIVLAIGSAFGLMGHCGVEFNPVVATTTFLLLGLGVDDAFVLIQAYHSAAERLGPEATVRERMGVTFETAGVSILFTSLTDILAFAVGATSAFPAVQAFCAYTATGVAFDFLFQCSLFGAVLAIDAHREYCGVTECGAWCGNGWLRNDRYSADKTLIKDGSGPAGGAIPVMPEVAALSRIMKAYGERLLTPMASAAVLVVFAGYLVGAVIGVTKVGTGLDLRDLAPSDSYWTVYVNQDFDFFQEAGPLFTLAFPHGSVDWTLPSDRSKAVELLEQIEGLACMEREPRGVWLREFSASSNTTTPVDELAGDDFMAALGQWLQGPGFEFQRHVLLEEVEDGVWEIAATRMEVRMEPLTTTSGDEKGVPCMQANRELLDSWAQQSAPAPIISFDAFRFWDGSAIIVEQTARNLIYAAVCCFAVTLCILPYPVLCIAAMAVVGSILAGVVAAMSLVLGIRIETISMINLVLSIGFSIDNVAHYCHAYMVSRAPTRREKAIDALRLIGIPILLGDASTLVALLALVGSKSQIFRSFFLILFTVLLLGALHAVVLLPVLLGLLGPLTPHPEQDSPAGPDSFTAPSEAEASKTAPPQNQPQADSLELSQPPTTFGAQIVEVAPFPQASGVTAAPP